jgi:hypothetical protein
MPYRSLLPERSIPLDLQLTAAINCGSHDHLL